uniref:Uncharacterized protein n=1 Tax=Parascaris univalens TaxID=6257 RepID=A0A914ZM70_PARUN
MSGGVKCITIIIVSLPPCLYALLDDGVALHNAEIRMRNNPYIASIKRAAEYKYQRANNNGQMGSHERSNHNVNRVIPEAIRNVMKREAHESTTPNIHEALEILNGTSNSSLALCCNKSTPSVDEETADVNATAQMASELFPASGSHLSSEGTPSREKIGALVIGLSVAILVVLFAVIIINYFTLKVYLSERRERKLAESLMSKSTDSDSTPRKGGGQSPEIRNHCNPTTSKEAAASQSSYGESPKFEGLPFEISIHPHSYLFHSCHSQAKSSINTSGRSVEKND